MAPPSANGINYPLSSFQAVDDQYMPNHSLASLHGHGHPAGLPTNLTSLPPSQGFLSDDAYSNFSAQGRAFQNGTFTPNDAPSNPAAANIGPQYNPAQLLDPRAYGRQQQLSNGQAQFNPGGSPAPHQVFTFDSPGGSPAVNGLGQQGYVNGSSYYGHGQNQNHYPQQGMGNMLERNYGIVERAAQPLKRRKIDVDDNDDDNNNKKKAVFNGGGMRGGVLGDAMREYREEGMRERVANKQAPIDLTSDNEEDLVVVGEVRRQPPPPSHQVQPLGNIDEVCYGRVGEAKINTHTVPTPSRLRASASSNAEHMWPQVKITLSRNPGCYSIQCYDATQTNVGCLDQRTTIGLNLVMDHVPNFRAVARILVRSRKPEDLPPGASCSELLPLDLNIYGPRSRAAAVGTVLSQKQIWLRTPLFSERLLFNPHSHFHAQIQKPAFSSSSVYSSGLSGMRTLEEVRNDVLSVFDSQEKSDKLKEMDPDPRIITPLLTHQKQGLYFMTNKEKERVFSKDEADNSSLWRLRHSGNGSKSYYNVITGQEEKQSPPQVLGGILADMMGLGKTLSVLSLLVGSQDESKGWAQQGSGNALQANGEPNIKSSAQPAPGDNLRRVKSTLLICPLSTISNWEEQMKQHIQPNSIKYYIYHGGNRCKDIQKLADYDLIITTYGSVGSEYNHQEKKGGGVYPLQSVRWFRIVLDEAHMIREQTTVQSKSICALEAQRRWAVTGTPVQNRLDDLGALLKFLRLKPFDERNAFSQYILAPMKSADVEVIAKLRILVDSVTLRRLKDKIDLPKRIDRVDSLTFDDKERKLYDIFAKNANDRVNVMATGGGVKSFSHILHSITRLRLICAHGESLLSDEDMKITEGLSKSSAIDLDSDNEDEDKPTLASKEAYNIFNFMVETGADNCALCTRKIGPSDEDSESDGRDEITGFMISCMNVLCTRCFKEYQRATKASSENRKESDCSLCEKPHRISFVALKQNQIEEDDEARAEAKESRGRKVKVLSRYTGPHTKTKNLIKDLLNNNFESESIPNEPPIKSVVFSTWTSHLNLIQKALEDNQIVYTRLDGTMNRTKRSDAMRIFKEDNNVTVILVSISAGGMGLNLTAASKVYVMEPQFNPAAEAQAVDRVHRLGQKREVETIRYIMKDSFEEKMVLLQAKKLKLASLSMDVGNKAGKGLNKLGLEELRDLFK